MIEAPEKGWCDYCTDVIREKEDFVYYICASTNQVYLSESETRTYCTSCGRTELKYPSINHTEILLYCHSRNETKQIILNFSTDGISVNGNRRLLDYSIYGEGYLWEFEEFIELFSLIPISPQTQKVQKWFYNPLAIIDFINLAGFYDIDILVKEDGVYPKGKEKEIIRYLVRNRRTNRQVLEDYLGIKQDMTERYF